MYLQNGAQLSYYSGSSSESDFIISCGDEHVGVEIKSGRTWRREYGSTLKQLVAAKKIARAYGVYSGDLPIKDGAVSVLPLSKFLDAVWSGSLAR